LGRVTINDATGCGVAKVKKRWREITGLNGLFFYGVDKRIDGVDAVDQRLVKADLREIDAELFFEKYHDLDGIHGSEPAAEKQRSIVSEGLRVALLQQQFFNVFANFFPVIHVFSSRGQIE
jgi:hypothetical protein